MKLLEPIDKDGKIRPVADPEYVGHPVVAYIASMYDGHYLFFKDQCVRRDSVTDALAYIEKVRRG